ncbi:hypothetical protein [Bordetella genomosp. 1]|uniref:hypothetical protein n=1 Tax=Bordetella genomosp. 1 TaxID=1395607 RepID=UPI001140DD9B|nr:hypothetical protein [Bordetella genomosp. 1]
MAIDLFCYSSASPRESEVILGSLAKVHWKLFDRKFLLSKVSEANEFHKEISLGYGMHARSFFMVRLNEKAAADQIPKVVELMKNSFNKTKFLVLHENEKPV